MSAPRVRALATILLLAAGLLVLVSLVLAMHFEATPRALEDAAKGQAVGIPAGLGAVAAVAALIGASRRWGQVALVVSTILVVLSAALLVAR